MIRAERTRSTRRWIGHSSWTLLIVFGCALLTIAIALPTVLMPKLKVLPADIEQTVVGMAENAEVLDSRSLANGSRLGTEKNVPLRLNVRVTSQPPTDKSRVTLSAAVRLSRADLAPEDNTVSAYLDRVSLNRETALPAPGGEQKTWRSMDTPADATPRTGYQYVFPFNSSQHSYPVYDLESRMVTPAAYLDDRTEIDGVRLLHYRQTIDSVNLYEKLGDVASVNVPNALAGKRGPGMTRFDLIYSNTKDFWVEPRTGSIVEQRQRIYRRITDGDRTITSLRAELKYSQDVIRQNASEARKYARLILWGNTIAPIVLGILGLLAAAMGSVLLFRRH